MRLLRGPLIARATVIKAIHFTQLRSAVNIVRAAASMPAFSFTDPVVAAINYAEGSPTIVKAGQVQELRDGVH